jgi:hypothetical protein
MANRSARLVLVTLAAAFAALASRPASAASALALVRTPSAAGPSTPQNLALSDGTLGPVATFNTWQEVSYGAYTITFPGLGSIVSSPTLAHVTAFGRTNLACATDIPVASGADLQVTVRCFDLAGRPAESRFALSLLNQTTTISGAQMGFFRTAQGPSFWTSDGSTPTLSHPSTGSFTVRFPTFKSTSPNTGNVLVTSTTAGRRCSIGSWSVSGGWFGTGTTINVKCVASGGTAADGDFYVSFGHTPMLASTDFSTFLQLTSPSTAGTQTPSASFQSLPVAGLATVTRRSTGRYVTTLPPPQGNLIAPQYAHDMTGAVTPLNAPGNTCVFVDWDSRGATVQCVDASGNAADTAFSLAMGSTTFQSPSGTADAPQISSKNFSEVADAGYGIACGVTAGTLPVNEVRCILATTALVSASSTSIPIAPGVTAPGAKALAIDNIDAGFTRILLLGADDKVYVASGDIRSPIGTAGNFDSYSVFADPLNPIGARLNFTTIASVRIARGSSIVVGLTTAGSLFELQENNMGAMQWIGSSYPIPAGVPLHSISHGMTDLYLLANDGRMFRSERGAASATQLPALPNGQAAGAMGGPFVRTNAGYSSNCSAGFCCTGPDANGQYPCDGDDQRFFQLTANNVWAPVTIQLPFPPAGVPSQNLTSGNPFTSSGVLVDARMFAGDVTGIMAWHYNSRLYYFHHTVY